MASTQSSRTTCSTSANTCCLTFISSKTASITKSASANASLVTEPVIRPLRRLAFVAVDAALGGHLVDLGVRVGQTLVHARLVEVGHDDRDL